MISSPSLNGKVASATPTHSDRALNEQLVEALAEYHGAIDAGQTPDRQSFLQQYPAVADELASYLDALDFVRNIAPQLVTDSYPLPARSAEGDGRGKGDLKMDCSPPIDGEGLGEGCHPASNIQHPVSPTLGDFRIIREIGRGGMGVVYEAEQLSLGRRVALKVLPFAAMLDKQQLNRFKNEARAAATLDHPNIVAIYSVGAERGVHYYAMQLIEGQSLAEVIGALREKSVVSSQLSVAKTANSSATDDEQRTTDAGDTPPIARLSTLPDFSSREYFRAVARLGIQAAEALDHAHQNGILHRDIKPANLLVDDTGKLWITDFGLARIEQDAGMTMTGDLLGTLRYMGPEQALGKRAVIDHRSDIYSLGVTIYELLTLHPAFAGDVRHELLRQIALEEPRKMRRINTRIPRNLETIVLKAMAKNPDQRYQMACHMVDDLQAFLESRPIGARQPTLLHRAAIWSRRHSAVLVSTLLAAVATVLALGLILVVSDQDGHEKARLVLGEGDKLEIVQEAPTAAPQSMTDEVLSKIRPIRSATSAFGDRSLALYFAYGPVDGGSTLVQVEWNGAVRSYMELPYSISGLGADKDRLLATVASSTIGEGRVVSIDKRGMAKTVFRDKKLLPDTIGIWSMPDSDQFLVADNGADVVVAIRKDGSRPEMKIRLPHTDNFQSMSVAQCDDGSVLYSDSDQNAVFRLPPGSGTTLGKPLVAERAAVAARPRSSVWVAAMEDNLHVFDGDRRVTEIAYPDGMTMFRPIIAFASNGTLVLGFHMGNRQYFYAVDLDTKKFSPLFTVDENRLTALTITSKMDWTEGDAVRVRVRREKK